MKFVYFFFVMFENDLESYCVFVDVVNCFLLPNGYLLIICVNKSFALHLRHGWDKYYVIRGCTNSKVISRAAMVIIVLGRYRASRWLLLSRIVSHAAIDAWTDMSPP